LDEFGTKGVHNHSGVIIKYCILNASCFYNNADYFQTAWSRIFSTANRAKYQKGIGYMGVKVFNRSPINVKKESDNSKKFRHSLKNFLREKSFYSLQEYFEL